MRHLLIILLFASCSTVHKTASKTKTSTDSTATSHTEATRVVRSDSTGNSTETGRYIRETVYEYDTVYLPGKTRVKYVPRIVRVVETGSYAKQDQAAKSSSDSVHAKADTKVEVKKDTVAKTTEKAKETRSWVPWLVLAFFIITGLCLWWVNRKPRSLA